MKLEDQDLIEWVVEFWGNSSTNISCISGRATSYPERSSVDKEWEIEHWHEVNQTWKRAEIYPLRNGSTHLILKRAMRDVVALQQMYPRALLRIRNINTGDVLPAAIL